MTARTLPTPRATRLALALAALAPLATGCGSLGKHKEDQIPQLGIIDPHQPRELDMVSQPQHVVEPPDELEINVRPTIPDLTTTSTLVVRADGMVDLGFYGDAYVAGLTLEQAELKIAQHLAAASAQRRSPIKGTIEVAARLVNGRDSKRYYVLGTVTQQNSFPLTGSETVLDAILTAGLRSNSLPEKAYLVRPHPNGGADQILRIDWVSITQRGDTLTNYQLFPGDRIYVPGGKPPGLLSSLVGGG